MIPKMDLDGYFFYSRIILPLLRDHHFPLLSNCILHLFDLKNSNLLEFLFFLLFFLFICLILSPEKIWTSIPYVATQLCTIYGGNLYLGLDSDMKKKSKEPKLWVLQLVVCWAGRGIRKCALLKTPTSSPSHSCTVQTPI